MSICGCLNPRPNCPCNNFIGYLQPVYTSNQQAWICPHCNKSNAPWMPYCCKGDQNEQKKIL